MKTCIAILMCAVLLGFASSAESGGAVAMQKRKSAMRSGQGPQVNMHQRLSPTGAMPVSAPHPGSLSNSPAAAAAVAAPVYQQSATPGNVFSTGVPQGRNDNQEMAPAHEEVQEVVTLDQLSENLKSSSQAWSLIIHPMDKEMVIHQFMEQYQQQGIRINKPPVIYAGMIDQMLQGDARMLDLPFDQVLKIMAIMEYDFDNGQDKDALARKVLGPAMYEKNKQRVMAEQQQQ